MEGENRLGRLLKLLQGSIRAAGLTQTQVDEQIGRRRGYLSHVFQRRVDLKLIDLLRALEVLQVEPGHFFSAAVGSRPENRFGLEDVVQVLAGVQNQSTAQRTVWQASSPSASQVDDQILLERSRRVVSRVLAEAERTAPRAVGREGLRRGA